MSAHVVGRPASPRGCPRVPPQLLKLSLPLQGLPHLLTPSLDLFLAGLCRSWTSSLTSLSAGVMPQVLLESSRVILQPFLLHLGHLRLIHVGLQLLLELLVLLLELLPQLIDILRSAHIRLKLVDVPTLGQRWLFLLQDARVWHSLLKMLLLHVFVVILVQWWLLEHVFSQSLLYLLELPGLVVGIDTFTVHLALKL